MKKKFITFILVLSVILCAFPLATLAGEASELNLTIGNITKDNLSDLPVLEGNIEASSPDEVCEALGFCFYLFNASDEMTAYMDASGWKTADGSDYEGTPDFSSVSYVIEEIALFPYDAFADTMTIKVNGGNALTKLSPEELHSGVEGYLVEYQILYVDIMFEITPRPITVDGITFQPWEKNNKLPSSSDLTDGVGSFYLTSDVTYSSYWNPPKGTINLCLNGHVINYTGTSSCSMRLNNATEFNLYDTDNETVHKGYTDASGLWHLDETGEHVLAEGETERNIVGGMITGNMVTPNSDSYNGSCVLLYNKDAKFTLNGGTICGNKGYGVFFFIADYGTFIMNGGSITGNASGGIYNFRSTVIINGGEICYNVSTGNGGGVINKGGSFTMTGGKIYGNKSAKSGGGVYCTITSAINTTVVLGGDAAIFGNKCGNADNDFFDNAGSNYITVSEDCPPKDGMLIGLASGKVAGLETEQAKYFFADQGVTAFDTDGNLVVRNVPAGQYLIKAGICENGVIYSSVQSAAPDSTVVLEFHGTNGYSLKPKTINIALPETILCPECYESIDPLEKCPKCGEEPADLSLTPGANGTYSFVMPACAVTVTAKFGDAAVLSLGAKVNQNTSSLRLGAKYNGLAITEQQRASVEDLGIVFYPVHLLGENSLDIFNSSAARVSACGIENFDEEKAFGDYESFVFYVTIVNIPDKGKDTDIAFRPFIIYDGAVEYGEVLARNYNGTLEAARHLAENEGENEIVCPDNWFN